MSEQAGPQRCNNDNNAGLSCELKAGHVGDHEVTGGFGIAHWKNDEVDGPACSAGVGNNEACSLNYGHDGPHRSHRQMQEGATMSNNNTDLLPPLTYELGYRNGFYDGARITLDEIEKTWPGSTPYPDALLLLRERLKKEQAK